MNNLALGIAVDEWGVYRGWGRGVGIRADGLDGRLFIMLIIIISIKTPHFIENIVNIMTRQLIKINPDAS